jgi:hypothetical protein
VCVCVSCRVVCGVLGWCRLEGAALMAQHAAALEAAAAEQEAAAAAEQEAQARALAAAEEAAAQADAAEAAAAAAAAAAERAREEELQRRLGAFAGVQAYGGAAAGGGTAVGSIVSQLSKWHGLSDEALLEPGPLRAVPPPQRAVLALAQVAAPAVTVEGPAVLLLTAPEGGSGAGRRGRAEARGAVGRR